MDAWKDGWMDARMDDGLMDEWMVCMYVCIQIRETLPAYIYTCGSAGDPENLLRTICGVAALVASGGQ